MIEYTDDKFGIIKVLNVTEARAHFATVLGDNHSHYVITKNNKPMRVIIGYGDYEKLKQQLGPDFVASIQQAGLNYPSQREETASTETGHKSKKAKSRVPGILESDIALSYSVPDKRQNTLSAKEVRQAPPTHTVPASEKQAPAFPEPTKDDYFSSASTEPYDEDGVLSNPDAVHTVSTEPQVPSTTQSVESITAEQSQAIHEALQQAIDANAKAKKSSPVERPTTPTAEAKKDPEQDEYFRKYKKLYERFETPQIPQTPAATESGSVVPGEGVFDDDDLEGELEAFSEPETKTARPTEEPNAYFGQPEQGEDATRMSRTHQPSDLAGSTIGQGDALANNKAQKGTSPEPPSLKDLLASLDEEKLSGEDEEVDESEIENLIQRIQED